MVIAAAGAADPAGRPAAERLVERLEALRWGAGAGAGRDVLWSKGGGPELESARHLNLVASAAKSAQTPAQMEDWMSRSRATLVRLGLHPGRALAHGPAALRVGPWGRRGLIPDPRAGIRTIRGPCCTKPGM